MKKHLLSFFACAVMLAPFASASGEDANPSQLQPLDNQPSQPKEAPPSTLLQRQIEWLKQPRPMPLKKEDALDLTGVKVEVRACTNADIIGGVWKMVYHHTTPVENIDRRIRRLDHQYISFNGSKYYAKIKSGRSIDNPQMATKLLQPDTRERFAQKYIIKEEDNKTEIVFMVGKEAIIRDSCVVVLKPVNVFTPGDMILQGYNASGTTLTYELYRRWF